MLPHQYRFLDTNWYLLIAWMLHHDAAHQYLPWNDMLIWFPVTLDQNISKTLILTSNAAWHAVQSCFINVNQNSVHKYANNPYYIQMRHRVYSPVLTLKCWMLHWMVHFMLLGLRHDVDIHVHSSVSLLCGSLRALLSHHKASHLDIH